MFDEKFWVAVALILFLALAGRKLWAFIAGGLDTRAARIRDELEQAVKLREEAQALLSQYQRQQREATREAEEILASARHEADELGKAAGQRLAEQLTRRERLAAEKIAQAEAKALKDIHDLVADVATAAAAKVIADSLDEKTEAALVDRSIESLAARLN